MENSSNQNSSSSTQKCRGRPKGKNRVPLSIEERRERNALYERERRAEMAAAMAQLAEAAGCKSYKSLTELLAVTISLIRKLNVFNKEQTAADLIRINKKLEDQIVILQSQLEKTEICNRRKKDTGTIVPLVTHSTPEPTAGCSYIIKDKPRKNQIFQIYNVKRNPHLEETIKKVEKRIKSSSATSDDSGVELLNRNSASPNHEDTSISQPLLQTLTDSLFQIQHIVTAQDLNTTSVEILCHTSSYCTGRTESEAVVAEDVHGHSNNVSLQTTTIEHVDLLTETDRQLIVTYLDAD